MCYSTEVINLNERKVISDDLRQKIKDLIILLEQHRGEINQSFDLAENEDYHLKRILRMHLIIEIFEFVRACKQLNNAMNRAVHIINRFYTEKNHDEVLEPIGRHIKRCLAGNENKITDLRNKIAAHRYTDDSGRYITVGEIIRLLHGSSIFNLNTYFRAAERCFLEINGLYPALKRYLILLRDSEGNPGDAIPNPEQK